MTERTRLISFLLYGLFSAEKKGNVFQYPLAGARGHSRSCSLNRNEPGHAIETRRNGFFDNEAIFVFITPRSRANLTTLMSQNKLTCVYKCREKFSQRPVITRKSCPLSSQSERAYYCSHIINVFSQPTAGTAQLTLLDLFMHQSM